MKKNYRALSMIMALVMVFSIFTFSAFAGDNDYVRYVTATGSATAKGTKSNPWSLDDLASEDAVALINEKISAGDRTGVVINVSSDELYYTTLVLNGIKGTATTPVTVVCNYNASVTDGSGSNSGLTAQQGNGIDIIDCTFITVKNISVSAVNGNGVHIKDSSDVVIENVDSYVANQSVKKTMNKPIDFEGVNKNVSITGCDFAYVEAPITINTGVENVSFSNGSVEYSKGSALIVDGVDRFSVDGFAAKAAYYVELPEVTEGEAIPEVEPVKDSAAVVIKNCNNVTFTNAKITESNCPAISLVNTKNSVVSKVFSQGNAAFMVNSLQADSYVAVTYCISSNDNKLPMIFSTTDTTIMGIINNTFYKPQSLDMSKVTNSVIYNNIYDMELLGEVKISKVNLFKTNCYHYTNISDGDNAVLAHPQYSASQTMTGTGLSEFILDDDSPMIEAGTNAAETLKTLSQTPDFKFPDTWLISLNPVTWFVSEDMFGNPIDHKAKTVNIGAYAGIGVQVKQKDEIDQAADLKEFNNAVRKMKIQSFLDKFIPAPVQEFFSNIFSKFAESATKVITKIIAKFVNK